MFVLGYEADLYFKPISMRTLFYDTFPDSRNPNNKNTDQEERLITDYKYCIHKIGTCIYVYLITTSITSEAQ